MNIIIKVNEQNFQSVYFANLSSNTERGELENDPNFFNKHMNLLHYSAVSCCCIGYSTFTISILQHEISALDFQYIIQILQT